MVLSSRNIFTETPKIMFGHVSGRCGPAKLTHEITHHRGNPSNHCFINFPVPKQQSILKVGSVLYTHVLQKPQGTSEKALHRHLLNIEGKKVGNRAREEMNVPMNSFILLRGGPGCLRKVSCLGNDLSTANSHLLQLGFKF